MTEQTANLCTTDAAESLRAVVAERDREIERLKEGHSILILARDEQKRLANEYRDLWSRAAVKAQPSGVVHHNLIEALKFYANGDHLLLADPDAWDTCSGEPINFLHDDAGTASVEDGSIAKAALDSLNSPLSAPSHGGGVAHTDCRSEDGITVGLIDSIITSCRVLSSRDLTCEAAVEALRDLRSDSDVSLIKPSHGEQVRELPPFAQKVISKLKRFEECASDSDAGGVDIGRHWLDLLTQFGLLNRVQRSPGLWEISQRGEDVLAGTRENPEVCRGCGYPSDDPCPECAAAPSAVSQEQG